MNTSGKGIPQRVYEAITANHRAYMGDDRREIEESEVKLKDIRAFAGELVYNRELDRFNEMISSIGVKNG
jgi:hypothetical protein